MNYDFESLYPTFDTAPQGDHNDQLNSINMKLNRILKRVKNRHTVNTQTGKEIFYDDDQTTILQRNVLKDINGNRIDSADNIADAVPEIINDEA